MNDLAPWKERSCTAFIIKVHANKPPIKINKRSTNPSLVPNKREANVKTFNS